MEAHAEQVVEVVQEGSRWRHGPPTPEVLGDWFKKQPLHDGMDHDRYVGGLVLIPSTDKIKRTKIANNGSTYVSEEEEATYAPYVGVDTRVRYFRDYVAMHEDWVGKMTPVPAKVIEDTGSAYFNAHIADRGFAIVPIRTGESTTFYVACTMEVAIYERESWAAKVRGERAEPILQGVATKQVSMTKSYGTNARTSYPDDNCLMKAETGAVGRALGFMGMLVIGTGVATAEDVQEATSGERPAPQADPALPPVVTREGTPVEAAQEPQAAQEPAVGPAQDPEAADEALREQALTIQKEIQEQFPDAWTTYMEWYRSRGFGAISTLSGPSLKTAVQKLERDLDAARTEAKS